ncbi:MAG: hypothetical protein AABY22_12480 [Nanoarchaeota archaeon]
MTINWFNRKYYGDYLQYDRSFWQALKCFIKWDLLYEWPRKIFRIESYLGEYFRINWPKKWIGGFSGSTDTSIDTLKKYKGWRIKLFDRIIYKKETDYV